MAPNPEFDFAELDDVTNSGEQEPEEQVVVARSTNTSFDERMSEVERRLEVAQYYRLLLGNTLFSEPSAAAEVVEHEIRDFVRGKLEELVGLGAPKKAVAEIFDESEIACLKALAAKVLKRPNVLGTAPSAPPVRKTTPPLPAAPKLNKVQVSKPKKVAVPKPPEQPKAEALPKPKTAKKQPDAQEGDIFTDEKTGKTYKWVYSEAMEKLVKMDITKKTVNPKAAPTPTKEQAAMLSEAQAAQQLASKVAVIV